MSDNEALSDGESMPCDEDASLSSRFKEWENISRSKDWVNNHTEVIFVGGIKRLLDKRPNLDPFRGPINLKLFRSCVKDEFWNLYLHEWRDIVLGEGKLDRFEKRRSTLPKKRWDFLGRFFSDPSMHVKWRCKIRWDEMLKTAALPEELTSYIQREFYPLLHIPATVTHEAAGTGEADGASEGNDEKEVYEMTPDEIKDFCRNFDGVHKTMPDPLNESEVIEQLDSHANFIADLGDLREDTELQRLFREEQERLNISVILFKSSEDFSSDLRKEIVDVLEEHGVHDNRPPNSRASAPVGLPITPIWTTLKLQGHTTISNDEPLGLSTAVIDPCRLHVPGNILQTFAQEGNAAVQISVANLLKAGFEVYRKVAGYVLEGYTRMKNVDRHMPKDNMSILVSRNLPLEDANSIQTMFNYASDGGGAETQVVLFPANHAADGGGADAFVGDPAAGTGTDAGGGCADAAAGRHRTLTLPPVVVPTPPPQDASTACSCGGNTRTLRSNATSATSAKSGDNKNKGGGGGGGAGRFRGGDADYDGCASRHRGVDATDTGSVNPETDRVGGETGGRGGSGGEDGGPTPNTARRPLKRTAVATEQQPKRTKIPTSIDKISSQHQKYHKYYKYHWKEPGEGVKRSKSQRQGPHMDVRNANGHSIVLSLNKRQPFDVYPDSGPGLELMRDVLAPLYPTAEKYYKENVHDLWAKWKPGRSEQDGLATYWCYVVHRLFVQRGVPLLWRRKRIFLDPGHGVVVSNYILHGGAEYEGDAAYRIHWYMTESNRLIDDVVSGIQVYDQVYDFQTDPIWFPVARYLDLEPSPTVDLIPRPCKYLLTLKA